jgi:hypothetical protein
VRKVRHNTTAVRFAVTRRQANVAPLRRLVVITTLSVLICVSTATIASAWVLWNHSYEVWVDGNKAEHRREVAWKKIATTTVKSDCESRGAREARAEYDTLTGRGIRATLAGSKVGFDQRNTRFKHGYRNFECWPDTVDPRGPKGTTR